MCGTLAPIRLKSASSSGTSASLAMASRCRTALVLPPKAMTTAMAFSNASRVRICRAVMPFSSMATTASPERLAKPSRRRSTAGGAALPSRLRPSASPTLAMVLAVYIPPQAPSPGQIARSMASTSSRLMSPRAQAPTASNASMIVTSRSLPSDIFASAGQDRAGVDERRGHVEAGGGHHHPGQRLVAAGEQDGPVEALGLHDGLDGVGDDLAADQAVVHADVAHGDAVGDADRAELHGEAAGGADALLGRARPAAGG